MVFLVYSVGKIGLFYGEKKLDLYLIVNVKVDFKRYNM